MSKGLIIALDYQDINPLYKLVDLINPEQAAVKVGSEAFTRFGPDLIKNLVARGFDVFLDLKFHDIPNTVAQACTAAADLGVWMMNVHASGGVIMMRAAKKALLSYPDTLLIAVTVLTSFSEADLMSINIDSPMLTQVSTLAKLAKESGLDGVVCSAHEAAAVKICCGTTFKTITPGIRIASDSSDDQVRIMTPVEAMKKGADYLVIGRPITQAKDPQQVIADIIISLRNE